jgi:hypothetical protein
VQQVKFGRERGRGLGHSGAAWVLKSSPAPRRSDSGS